MRTVARGICCAALVLLAAAAALSLWSLFGASNISWDVAPIPYQGVVDQLGWYAFGGAIVPLVFLLNALRGRRWGLALFVALGSAIALVASIGLYPDGLFATYRALVSDYAATQALPAALAAWVLAVAGCTTLVLAGLPLIDMGPAHRREWIGGAAVGVVVAALVGGFLLRDANPGRQFEATVAQEAEAPDLPATFLGNKRFSVGFDSGLSRNSWETAYSLQAAGTGFVVREHNGVRAYDAEGTERWHLLHTGGWQVEGFQVFDDLKTVVVLFSSDAYHSGEVVGLDATTGRQLWRSADLDLFGSPGVDWIRSGDDSGLFYLTVQDGDELTRLDSRTGDRLWSVQVPAPIDRIDTRSGIGYLTGSVTGERVQIRYVSLDPETGRQRFDVVADEYPVAAIYDRDALPDTSVFSVVHAGRDGVAFRDRLGRTFYVNGVTGAATPLEGRVKFGYPAVDAFIEQFRYPQDNLRRLREGSDAAIRCTLPDGISVGGRAFLRDEMVASERGDGLAAVRRSDCSMVSGRQHVAGGSDVVVVPGAILVVDHRTGTITGYS
ncbi:PQQ-binding-like beta-propeller repeat protein [Mycolicibacterium peregrinum]|uniref:outer membrane protein assembly factor BamB family protein n=1 Tax=Mycolicibacterium peregrinum TaxID=43304 RepID=UPI0010420CCA|nr:PQQ-binding-like beta-propeller repeat protein [Mycolicibacterium peregrinum]